ncbi:MAG: DUF4388 domain-containing protein [Thermoanaerobaculia bacterium]
MSFEGEIGEIDLVQRLVDLGRERFTGAIRFENDGIIKIVYFKGGDILSASTNDRGDSIDEILFRAGKVTREHIKQALGKRKETETLGDALLGLGFITRKELTWARRVQVIGIIRSTLTWKAGSWTIVDNYLPKREEGTIFPLPQVILELIVTDQDRPKFEQAMESGSSVFHRVDGFDESFRRLGLNEDAEAITAHLDGIRSAADVASASGKDIFNVYKLLEALRVLGLLERDRVTPEIGLASGTSPLDSAGVDNPGFNLHDEPAPMSALEEDSAPTPSWDLDEEPAPAMTADLALHAQRDVAPVRSQWDEPEEMATPAAGAVLPPEPQWGFDEAQIEAARRVAVPVRAGATAGIDKTKLRRQSPPARPMRAIGGIVALLLLLVGGWAGWTWWQARQRTSPAATTAAAAPPRIRRQLPPVIATTSAASTGVADLSATSPRASGTSSGMGGGAVSATNPPVGSNMPGGTPSSTEKRSVAAPPIGVSTSPAARKPEASTAARSVSNPAKAIPPAPAQPKKVAAIDTPRVEQIGTASATITNGSITNGGSAPVASGNASELQRKYESMGRDFRGSSEGNFTYQIELVCETASVTRALGNGGARVWFVPTTFKGRSCYRIFWGRFDTNEAALAATRSIPAGLKGSAPVVIRIPR